MTSPTPNLKEAIDDLTAKLKDHIEHEHPDPDMTKPCMFKQDVDDELLTLFDSALAAKDAECEKKWGQLLEEIRKEAYERSRSELQAHAPGVIVDPYQVKWNVFEKYALHPDHTDKDGQS